jgi:hypothetical protein
MRDRVAKFGSFGGIDANCGNYAVENSSWLTSLESAPAWGHRDANSLLTKSTDSDPMC